MGLLSWLRRPQGKAPPVAAVAATAETQAPVQPPPGEKEVFQSPLSLAQWVETYLIKGLPREHYDELLPSEDIRRDLKITVAQRERCVREYLVLRIAGVMHFVKEHYPDAFWVSFARETSARLREYLYPGGGGEAEGLAQALEDYVAASQAKDVDQCASLYLTRVYDDNENCFKLKFAGVGFISVEYIASGYEVFRDAYYQVTQGMSYGSLKAIAEAMAKIKER